MVQVLPGSLKIPSFLGTDSVDIWLEEQVWGHRFFNDQTPWLVLLEAIGLMAFRAQDQNGGKQVFTEAGDEHENLRYELKEARQLRRILFSDRQIDEIADQHAVSDVVLWKRWFGTHGAAGETDFGYLQSRFVRFSSFRNAVTLLRGSEVEPHRKRRDRKFFRRGGELLFLMLNRSGKTAELEPLVKDRLLLARSRWNRLAEALSPPVAEPPVTFANIGYLPLAQHDTYRILGEDWLALLKLKALPDDNLSDPLMRLSSLAVVRYVLERAGEVLKIARPLMPIDAMGSATAGIRKLSKDHCSVHRDMTGKAVIKIVDDFINGEAWAQVLLKPNPTKAALELVDATFGFEPKEAEDRTISRLPQAIKDAALDGHNDHLGLVPGFYAEQIGLAAKQGSARWYILSDAMLEAVVLANVAEPLEYEVFLESLYKRYRFVIGTKIASAHYTGINDQQVKANQRHLEERLRTLGLLKRLSDDCAFVVNPFWSSEVAG